MGLRKKIKKAVKKVTKVVTKPVKQVAKVTEKVAKQVIKKPLEAVGGAVGLKPPKVPEAVQMDAPSQSAVQVEVAGEDAKPEVEGGSESDKRKTQSRGKGKLTVARKSGRGLNI